GFVPLSDPCSRIALGDSNGPEIEGRTCRPACRPATFGYWREVYLTRSTSCANEMPATPVMRRKLAGQALETEGGVVDAAPAGHAGAGAWPGEVDGVQGGCAPNGSADRCGEGARGLAAGSGRGEPVACVERAAHAQRHGADVQDLVRGHRLLTVALCRGFALGSTGDRKRVEAAERNLAVGPVVGRVAEDVQQLLARFLVELGVRGNVLEHDDEAGLRARFVDQVRHAVVQRVEILAEVRRQGVLRGDQL